jgi:hypothetical protein
MPKSEDGEQQRSRSHASGLLRGGRGDDMLHALPTAAVLLDLDGNVALANHVAQRQLDQYAAGSKFVEMVTPADRKVLDG